MVHLPTQTVQLHDHCLIRVGPRLTNRHSTGGARGAIDDALLGATYLFDLSNWHFIDIYFVFRTTNNHNDQENLVFCGS
jgi:hypothetical protein